MMTGAAMRRCAALAAAIVLGAGAALAQLASDDVPRERTIPEKEQVEADMQRSRLRLGPMRLIPSIAVTNAGYETNVFGTGEDPVGDWSFTVRGGLRFIVPLGSKMYLRGDVLPQYTWYDKLADRRSFGGLYQASLLGLFNRMSAHLSAYHDEGFNFYSSEVQTRVLTRTQDASAGVEVELARSLSLFGRGEVQRIRYSSEGQPPDSDVTENNRTDTLARGGMRYRISREWDVSTAFEQTWSDFELTPETRNNQSRAYLAGVYYSRPRLYVNLSGGYREGRARDDSSFPEYSTGTGSFFLSYFPIRWLEIQGYGRRRVAYSVTSIDPYYFESRIGGGLNIEVLSRVLLRGFGEAGPDQYQSKLVDGDLVPRRDDVRLYGGGLSMILVRPVVLTGLISRRVYRSNSATDDRTTTRYTVTLSFLGEFVR